VVKNLKRIEKAWFPVSYFYIHGVAFSRDGKRLATASGYWTVQICALDLRGIA